MKVLFVATEMDPFFKVGGLGDVIGSLPLALLEMGLEVAVVLPLYGKIDRMKWNIKSGKWNMEVQFSGKDREVQICEADYKGLGIYFIENEGLIGDYGKVAIAGDQAEVDHYAFFSRVVTEWLLAEGSPEFDIVHLHDWHTGLIPRLYRLQNSPNANLAGIPKFVFTIHNLGYHGFSKTNLVKRLGIENLEKIGDDPYFDFDAREDNELDLLLQGLLSSDFITTVSPTYAKEITTPEYCSGLCDVLRIRSNKLVGVLNGIDYEVWDPATDKALVETFSINDGVEDVMKKRRQNKIALQRELGLGVDELSGSLGTCLLGFVGRLDLGQKGLDILYETLDQLFSESDSVKDNDRLACPLQFIMIGEGDPEWEEKFKLLAKIYPRKISVNIKFDDALARRIYASSDVMLIPSKYEPCGLVQMIAMRYGAIPVVRSTGGLKDTVEHEQDGFVFRGYDAASLYEQTSVSIDKFLNQPDEWSRMVGNAMRKDFTWGRSARKYQDLYRKILDD